MRSLTNRLIFIKMRRIFELLTLSFFVIIIITITSKWSSSPITNDSKYLNVKLNNNNPVNLFAPRNQSFYLNDNIMINKILNGQPDLAKYIHLDLKGAPPQADKFYENFFSFIDKLQMGVKGILIEYEDTLPLQGRLVNVSFD
jgi:hypothetical protein